MLGASNNSPDAPWDRRLHYNSRSEVFELVQEWVFHHSFGERCLRSPEKFTDDSCLVLLLLLYSGHLYFQLCQCFIHFTWLSGFKLSILLYAIVVTIVVVLSMAMAFFFVVPYIGRLVLIFLLLQM